MSELKKLIAQAQKERDRRIQGWLKAKKSINWIADELDVSRQRIQQIAARLGWKKPA